MGDAQNREMSFSLLASSTIALAYTLGYRFLFSPLEAERMTLQQARAVSGTVFFELREKPQNEMLEPSAVIEDDGDSGVEGAGHTSLARDIAIERFTKEGSRA